MDASQHVISPRVSGSVPPTLRLWTSTLRGAYYSLVRQIRGPDNISLVGFGCINSKYSVNEDGTLTY